MDLFSRLDLRQPDASGSLQDVARREEFHSLIRDELDASLNNPSRLHGWRVQGLFEAMVVCLGYVRLIKEEDAGLYFFDDGGGDLRPPDFRIVTCGGEHVLVEVKGVSSVDSGKPWQMRLMDLQPLLDYSKLTGARLLLAHYWSGWNRWTLVDPAVLVARGAKTLRLNFETAMKKNELGILGDAEIGTTPPLVLSLIARSGHQDHRDFGDRNEYRFVVGATEVSAAGAVLTDPEERRVAWFLMLHGGWPVEERPVIKDGRVVRIDYVFEPPESSDEELSQDIFQQGFAMVGSLSSMYSHAYNEATLTEAGEVRKLRHEPEPGSLSALIPANYWDRGTDRKLPIWKFTVQAG
ncbi:hypothetical protein ACWEVP_02960 [Amycolatopsis sp. NPDC003865]